MPDQNIYASQFNEEEYLKSDLVAEFSDYCKNGGIIPKFE